VFGNYQDPHTLVDIGLDHNPEGSSRMFGKQAGQKRPEVGPVAQSGTNKA
jgi:hypothetical protein